MGYIMRKIICKFLKFFPSKNTESLVKLRDFLSRENGIIFNIKKIKDESGEYFIAESTNIPNKNIITTGKSLTELDHNIKDAIFTAFHIAPFHSDFNLLASPVNRDLVLRYASA